MSIKNRSFVYIKPSANRRSIQALVGDWLVAKNFKITARGNFSGGMEDEFEIQHVSSGRKATILKPYELNVPVEGLALFQECYGLSWAASLEEGLIRNALESMDILDIDAARLLEEWMKCKEAGTMVKLGRNMYCALIDIPGKPALFCINGFYPALREEYTTPGASIHYFCVEWDDSNSSWSTFRQDVIGCIDPARALPNTLRGVIHSEWADLGLPRPPNMFHNAIHASSSAFEAFSEHLNWLKISINNDPLGCYLYQLGLTPQTLKDWLANTPVRGKHALDYFEDKGSDQCIEVVRDIMALGEGAQSDFLRLRNGEPPVEEGQDGGSGKRRNACLLFIKPHANTAKVRTLVTDSLRAKGFIISEERAVPAQVIDKDLLIDKQYANIARMALFLSPKDYHFSPRSYIRFQKKFNTSWSDELANDNICNANEIVSRLEISHSQLTKAWSRCIQEGNFIQLEREFYCGYIDSIHDKPALFCINGFYMSMRAEYLAPGASIHCYTVEWEDDVVSWESFLRDVVGAAVPQEAREGSLRSQLSKLFMELDIPAPLGIQNNGLHASSSAFEAMVERSIWFKQSLKGDQLFGKRLLEAGVGAKTLREWSMNCILQERRVFDHMLHLGADDCLNKARELLGGGVTTSTALQLHPGSSALATPHPLSLPAITKGGAAAAHSGSKSLNRRLFERAMAQDYKEFANNESHGFSAQYGNPENHPQNYQQIHMTQQNTSYQKTTTYADSAPARTLWSTGGAGARDRYITDTLSLNDSECEPNTADQPAPSSQQQQQHARPALSQRGGAGPPLDRVASAAAPSPAKGGSMLYEI